MGNLEFYCIMLAYTVLDMAVGVGIGFWIAMQIVEREVSE